MSGRAHWRRSPLRLVQAGVVGSVLMSGLAEAQATHEVWDLIWHTGSGPAAVWGPGDWTKSGVSICATFPGGATTTPPPDVHLSDHVICPDWPDDWHWTVDFTWNGTPIHTQVWFVGIGPNDEPGLDIYCSSLHPTLEITVDLSTDTYTLTDTGAPTPFFSAAFSGYPGNLPADFTVTGLTRSSPQAVPAMTEWAMVTLLLAFLGGGVLLLRRRRAPLHV